MSSHNDDKEPQEKKFKYDGIDTMDQEMDSNAELEVPEDIGSTKKPSECQLPDCTKICEIQELLCSNRVDDAYAKVVHSGNYRSPFHMGEDEIFEDNYCEAVVVSAKQQVPDKQDIISDFTLTITKYSRLLLMREITTGESFFIIYLQDRNADIGLQFLESLLGTYVAIYEATKIGKYLGNPLLTVETSLMPINPLLDKVKISAIEGLDNSSIESMDSFLFMVDTPELMRCNLKLACGTRHCDGRHDADTNCPATKCHKRSIYLLHTYVKIPEDSVKKLYTPYTLRLYSTPHYQSFSPIKICEEYQSQALSKLFLSEDVMKNCGRNLKLLRPTVKDILSLYREQDVKWIILGWTDRATVPDTIGPLQIHLTSVYPQKVLEHQTFTGVEKETN